MVVPIFTHGASKRDEKNACSYAQYFNKILIYNNWVQLWPNMAFLISSSVEQKTKSVTFHLEAVTANPKLGLKELSIQVIHALHRLQKTKQVQETREWAGI